MLLVCSDLSLLVASQMATGLLGRRWRIQSLRKVIKQVNKLVNKLVIKLVVK